MPLTRARPGVLVAQGEAVAASEVARVLRAAGARITSAVSDPTRFAECVKQDRPALALVDIRFGATDGIDLVEALPAEARPRIVFLGAHADASTVGRAVRAGCAGFVTKPFSDEQLLATVRVALESPVHAPSRGDATATLAKIASIVGEAELGSGPVRAESSSAFEVPISLDLSPREREVVAALVRHGRVARVATALHISTHTARNHLKTIYQKLDVHSIDELFDRVHEASRASASREHAPRKS
jgi:DNA-binding NarL/FixJ family response regulator